MLQQLKIENYALIRQLEISVGNGFTVITGETGAGKSIILGALSLILGQRADSQTLFEPNKKCVIQGTFEVKGYDLQSFFEQNDLDYDDRVFIHREILPNGKSRAFINETPVSLQILKELGICLVDIHSQNSADSLNNHAYHREILDDYAGMRPNITIYQNEYQKLTEHEFQLQQLRLADLQAKQDQDYYQFLFDELKNASLIEGEQEELEEELQLQTHAEEIKSAIFSALNSITDDAGLNDKLTEILSTMRRLAKFHASFESFCNRFDNMLIELKDIHLDLERIDQTIVYDSDRIALINDRLNLIYSLQQKHRVNDIAQLLEKQNGFADKLDKITTLADKIESAEKQLDFQRENVYSLARELSIRRQNAVKPFSTDLLQLIKQLGMPDATLKVEITASERISKFGIDEVKILFNANRGGALKEISQIASGGELSRVMLSLKHLLAAHKNLPTMIFDEIDSGISGEIAGKMGKMMQKMAQTMQIITITHLPQIAAKADAHFLVYKSDNDHLMQSEVRLLNMDERIFEIAKLLSDEKVTESGISAAKELIAN